MMRRLLTIALAGCGSAAPRAPAAPAPTPAATGAPAAASAPAAEHVPAPPVKIGPPPPAGPDGVEILVTNVEWARALVVTDDRLYWISGGHFDRADVFSAPHQRGASPTLVHDSQGADQLIAIGDDLYWIEDFMSIYTTPRVGGPAHELLATPDSTWQLVERDGLVVAGEDDKGNARVYRVSATGETSELVRMPRAGTPTIAFAPDGALYVATFDLHGYKGYKPVIGRVRDGTLASGMRSKHGALRVAADAEALYAIVHENLVGTGALLKWPHGANKPVKLAKAQAGSITALAVDATYVYWSEYVSPTTDGKIWRLPRSGQGKPEAIADCGEITRLVFYGPDLYWADARKNVIARIRR